MSTRWCFICQDDQRDHVLIPAGCPNLTDGRFCEEHAKVDAKRYERYERDTATKRRYGRAWKRIKDSYAAAHLLCEVCLEKGVYTPTEEIHHIKPLSQGGTHDIDNLKALCKACHARIHAAVVIIGIKKELQISSSNI